MKNFTMKSIFAFLATAMLAMILVGCGGEKKEAAPADAAKGGKWVVAINSTFPPFESVKEGTKEYQGVDIDIANYIAKKMNKQIEFSDMKFASLVPTLQSGRADIIISAISPTAEREKVVSFSKPYYFPMKALICKKGAGYDALDKLKGQKAGASMGTTFVKELKAVGGIDVVEMDTTPLVIQDIKNGRLAAGLFDSSQAAVFVKQNPELEIHVLQGPVLKDDTFAIALPKDSKDVEKINEILKEMRTNGELHKILVAHLGEEGTKEYEAAIEKLDIAKL